MVLKSQAVAAIIETSTLQLELAKELGFTQGWVISLAKKNKHNGDLTTYAAVQVIRRETNLSENQILEEAPVSAKV